MFKELVQKTSPLPPPQKNVKIESGLLERQLQKTKRDTWEYSFFAEINSWMGARVCIFSMCLTLLHMSACMLLLSHPIDCLDTSLANFTT
jgi:hypothetical protein